MRPISQTSLTLPDEVVGKNDVGRLLREAKLIDSFLEQAVTRKPGTSVMPPRSSQLFNDFVAINKLNVLHRSDRVRILSFLIAIKAMAPRIRISFGTDPAPTSIQKVVAWLRNEIHPLVLLQVGLQPTIGLGFVVSGTNNSFDFSLRERFKQYQSTLVHRLHFNPRHSLPARTTISYRRAPSVRLLTRSPMTTQSLTEAELIRAAESGLVALESMDFSRRVRGRQVGAPARTRGKRAVSQRRVSMYNSTKI